MATITDYKCFLGDKPKSLPTDAFGNNVAFVCPCGHPVLLLTHDGNQRGMSAENPSICQKCNRRFWVQSIRPTGETGEVRLASSKE